MLYFLATIQILLAVIFGIGIFHAGTTVSSLIGLFGFALFATLAFRSLVKIRQSRPKGAPEETPAVQPIFENNPYAHEYPLTNTALPVQNTLQTTIPQPTYVDQPYQTFAPTPAPYQTFAPAPAQTAAASHYNPAQTNMLFPGVIGGAAGFAVGAALAHQHDIDQSHAETAKPVETFMLPPVEADAVEAAPVEPTPVEPTPVETSTDTMLPPITADELPDPVSDHWSNLTIAEPSTYEAPATYDAPSFDSSPSSFD